MIPGLPSSTMSSVLPGYKTQVLILGLENTKRRTDALKTSVALVN